MGLINASNHPVYVKKVGISIWTLRDEIENAVRGRYDEAVAKGTEPFILDLQDYYSPKNAYDPSNLTAQGLDSCGNPLDEDAAAMLAAIQGGDDTTDTDSSGNPIDEDAEAMAAAINGGEEAKPEEVPDSDAEAMAKEMLAGQTSDSDAEAMAKEMLAGQLPEKQEELRTAKNYIRKSPSKEKVSSGFCLLSDLNMDTILFFSHNTFLQGQTIVLEFQIPKKFIITCEILKSTDIDRTSKIISETKPRFRIQALIKHSYPGERSQLREFLKSVEPDIPPPPTKLKRKNNDEEADEFEDLGF